MGTPNRLDMVMGEATVSPEDLSLRERYRLIRRMLKRIKPQLQSVIGFTTAGAEMNRHLREYDYRQTDMQEVKFEGEGLSADTRYWRVIRLSHDIEGVHNSRMGGYGAKFVILKDILLTYSGELVLREWKYERQILHGQGFRGHRTGVREVTVGCVYRKLSKKGLLQALIDPKVVLRVLQSLHRIMASSVEQKRMHLQGMVSDQQFLQEAIIRLGAYPHAPSR